MKMDANVLTGDGGSLRGGYLEKDVAGSADVTLTTAELENGLIKLTGTLTGNINVIIDTVSGAIKHWLNATSGAYSVTVKTAAGTGIAVGQGKAATLACDGTDVVRLTADV